MGEKDEFYKELPEAVKQDAGLEVRLRLKSLRTHLSLTCVGVCVFYLLRTIATSGRNNQPPTYQFIYTFVC